jgi:hypothetical protein
MQFRILYKRKNNIPGFFVPLCTSEKGRPCGRFCSYKAAQKYIYKKDFQASTYWQFKIEKL